MGGLTLSGLTPKIAVIIPCYKVKQHILPLLDRISDIVWRIYVVDDCCPEESGRLVTENTTDSRVVVLRTPINLGVGGAVLTGFKCALEDGADILVKIDGDGQMDPDLLPLFVNPIVLGRADYTKGNRFHNPSDVVQMPKLRLIGNAFVSFVNKISSGYWNIFDPTNGYLAINAKVAALLPIDKIAKRYFFESDMLFRLNLIKAVVVDIPMKAVYGDEKSNLKISRELFNFLLGHLKNTVKRIFYNYYLRDLTAGSVELILGLFLFSFGFIFGLTKWIGGVGSTSAAPSATVMLAALPIILGLQFLLAFLNSDIASVPYDPIQSKI
ncbi:MAG: glycosyltransferase family 2 protein [Deltaproteobacteria bacterium]|jgi:glycosyltransferase involved in cell wall biosynthesis|nr:glycosyltransferase family 2 protein [Deltaproteobacteria bacterium]